MTRELATKMECNFCSPMKMPQEICGSDFLKEIGKGNLGRLRDEIGRSERRGCGVIKREAK
jgi:hypothetical protein